MAKILEFVITKKSIIRKSKKELLRLYQLSAGGNDPIVDERAWEDFEAGYIDEMPWVDFASICYRMYIKDDEDK